VGITSERAHVLYEQHEHEIVDWRSLEPARLIEASGVTVFRVHEKHANAGDFRDLERLQDEVLQESSAEPGTLVF